MVVLTGSDREKLASSNGKFAQYLTKILDRYFSYHLEAYNTDDKLNAPQPHSSLKLKEKSKSSSTHQLTQPRRPQPAATPTTAPTSIL
ncbi:hypothetical protein S83_066338, partial [Arachis hypogaea]